MLRRFILAVAVTLTAVLSIGGTGQLAHASTPGCTAGAFAGYCGTQTDAASPAMSWDVFRQGAKIGQALIAYPNSDSDPAVDFVALAPGVSHETGSKMFIYAPDGVISDLCISEPAQGADLVLKTCNGSRFQIFIAEQVGDSAVYEWANEATGDVVSANGIRSPLTGVSPPSAPGPGVEWTFAG